MKRLAALLIAGALILGAGVAAPAEASTCHCVTPAVRAQLEALVTAGHLTEAQIAIYTICP